MRRSIIISAVLLPAVAVPAGAYLLGVWPRSSVQAPKIADTKPSNPPAEIARRKAGSAPREQQRPGEVAVPAFLDVARIDPKGPSVFAGRAEPDSQVTVLADDQVMGTVRSDKYGEWALLAEKPVPSKDSKITLRVTRREFAAAPQEQSGKAAGPEPAKLERFAAVGGKGPSKNSSREKRARNDDTAKAVTARLMEQMKRLVETEKNKAKSRAAGEPASLSEKPDSEIAPPVKSWSRSNQISGVRSDPSGPGRETVRTGGEFRIAAARDSVQPSLTGIVPVPIKFVFEETSFTPDGAEAAKLLLAYIKLKGFKSIILSGHADERGTEPFNYELSRKRLEAVSDYLRAGGFEGQVVVVPKGETQPFEGVDRLKYSKEELWQLDRRVELHISE